MKEFLEESYSVLKNKIWFNVFKIAKVKKNKIVMCNFFGNGFGDNPKYIALEIMNRFKNVDIVWLLNSKNKETDIPSEIRTVKYNSVKGIYELATARIWIDNCRKLNGEIKRKKQYYIQTWHGLGPKQCEKDVETKLSKSYIRGAKRDSSMADLFISPARFLTNLYRRSFWYNGEILEVGYPRNDIFVNEDQQKIRKKIHNYYSIPDSKKILVYAPTFRNSHKINCYDIEFDKCKEALEKKWGNEWVVLFRLHPNMVEEKKLFKFDDVQFFNASDYFDAQELLAGADALISDYSSIIVDFFCTNRPSFIYAPDIREYEVERNFYFDLNEMPAPICKNNEELIKNIIEFQESEYSKRVIEFSEKMGVVKPGKASKEVVNRIAKIIEQKNAYT